MTPVRESPVRGLGGILGPRTSPVDLGSARLGAVLAVADRHRLVPAVWSRLLARGEVQPVPASVRQVIADRRLGLGAGLLAAAVAHADNASRVDDLLGQADAALRALTDAGLRAAPLKGIDAVLTSRYPDPAARTMTDIDLLVDEDGAEAASRVLAGLGYRPVPGAPAASHQLPAVRLAGHAGSIELHTKLAMARWEHVLDPRRALDRAVPAGAETDAGAGLRLRRTDSIAHLVVHAQLHDDGHLMWRLPLRSIHETALALTQCEPVDWAEIDGVFSRSGQRRALLGHLGLVRSIFGVDAPLPVTARGWGRARVVVGLDVRPRLGRAVTHGAYLPRALSAERMREVHGATGPLSVQSARVAHALRAIPRRASGTKG